VRNAVTTKPPNSQHYNVLLSTNHYLPCLLTWPSLSLKLPTNPRLPSVCQAPELRLTEYRYERSRIRTILLLSRSVVHLALKSHNRCCIRNDHYIFTCLHFSLHFSVNFVVLTSCTGAGSNVWMNECAIFWLCGFGRKNIWHILFEQLVNYLYFLHVYITIFIIILLFFGSCVCFLCYQFFGALKILLCTNANSACHPSG